MAKCEKLSLSQYSIRLLLVAVFLSFTASSLVLAQEEGNAKPQAVIETGSEAPSDTDIDQRIEEIFGEIEGLEKVRVSVNSGVVTLAGEVAEAPSAVKAEELAARVNGVVAVENEILEQTAVSERLVPVLGRFEKRLKQVVDYLPLAGLALMVWAVITALGWFVSTRQRPWSWFAPNAFIADLLRQLVFLAFVVLGIVIALDILGATAVLGTILGAAGIVGLAIGFAVRDTVENYIASILLSIRQPFMRKDLVAIDGFEGHVVRLTSRATILMDRDGNHIRIPNSTVYKSNILNYSRNPVRRFTFTLGVDADSVLHEALEICHAELKKMPFVLNRPEPDAWIEEVGDSNVLVGISGWIDQTKSDFVKARSEAIRLVKNSLETHGFALPEPIYRLRIDNSLSPGGEVSSKKAEMDERRAKITKPVPPAPEKAAESVVADTDVDDTVVKKIEEEQAIGNGDDLLSEDARNEFGPSEQTQG